MRGFIKNIVPAAAVAVFACSGAAMAKTIELSGKFMTEGKATTTPTGTVTATLDTVTDELKYTVTYGGLSGPVMAAHFHGPAAAGVEAGVLVPIKPPYASPISGEAMVTPVIAKDLEDGMTYVNLHTAADPMGEARAQITEAK